VPRTSWLTPYTETIWNSSPQTDWDESYQPLRRLLYEIGFLGLQKSVTSRATHAYESPDLANFAVNFPHSLAVTIHPTFRRALDTRERRDKISSG